MYDPTFKVHVHRVLSRSPSPSTSSSSSFSPVANVGLLFIPLNERPPHQWSCGFVWPFSQSSPCADISVSGVASFAAFHKLPQRRMMFYAGSAFGYTMAVFISTPSLARVIHDLTGRHAVARFAVVWVRSE